MTFDLDLDLEHILDGGLSGDHRVQVWSRSSHLSGRRSYLRKMFTDRQTDGRRDGRRTPHVLIPLRNELIRQKTSAYELQQYNLQPHRCTTCQLAKNSSHGNATYVCPAMRTICSNNCICAAHCSIKTNTASLLLESHNNNIHCSTKNDTLYITAIEICNSRIYS